MNRSVRSWYWLPFTALVVVMPLNVGCDITPEPEEDFELIGVLSQATRDTTTTDHFRPSVSPDGTRILFITDGYAEDKQDGETADFAIVSMPGIGEIGDLVNNFRSNPGWTRINLGMIPDDSGSGFNPNGRIKGEAAWRGDSQSFVAVLENPVGNTRLYDFALPPDDGSGQISVISSALIDDVDFGSVGNRNAYAYLSPAVSPDGEWLAYSRFYFNEDSQGVDYEFMAIHAYNFATGETVRVTNGSIIERDPSWSPDGSQLVFTAQAGQVGTFDILKVNFDPTTDADTRVPVLPPDDFPDQPFTDGRVRLTRTSEETDWKLPVGSFNPAWLADGRIVFTSTRRVEGASVRIRNLWKMSADGSNQEVLHFSRSDDEMPAAANFINAPSDARSLIVWTTRQNRSDDFVDQKQDLWVLRNF